MKKIFHNFLDFFLLKKFMFRTGNVDEEGYIDVESIHEHREITFNDSDQEKILTCLKNLRK